MTIRKSEGVTPTEQLLAGLCDRSFLKLWSYPNPIKEDGDELCDLLAVFENHVFIFFDRENRQLDDSEKDPAVVWQRWKRKTIDAQVRTAHGAAKYILGGRPIYLDKARTTKFPLQIPTSGAVCHKIVVAHGAKEACLKASDANVYGSLAVTYSDLDNSPEFPFWIKISRSEPVHIFDSHNLPIILSELDTVTDFSMYLSQKIAAINSIDYLAYCGEEDLLAHYFGNWDEATNLHYIGSKDPSVNGVFISEGEWHSFCQLEIYRRKKQADEVSYMWDELLQLTCQHALSGTLLGNANFEAGDSALHVMAKEPRFMRRGLAAHMLFAIEKFPESDQPLVRNVSLMPSFYKNVAYVFLQLKVMTKTDYEEYRAKRRAMLEIACGAAKNYNPKLETVIGIAIDAPKYAGDINSEDFLLLKCADWSDDVREHYEQANELFNFFKTSSLVRKEVRVAEFPS